MATTSDRSLWQGIFNARSIAVVGVSSSRPNSIANTALLKPLLLFGYGGNIYPINPNASEIQGIRAYPSVRDVPGDIDYVICAIPAQATPDLIEECASKGVKAIHIYASGFREAGPQGEQLENELLRRAREAGIRIIGPNCMGIYSPRAGISNCDKYPREAGPVALVCQSGGMARELITMAALRGVRFSKLVSYGNAADLNECDYLEYLAGDDDTHAILMFIEAARDGQRFRQLLARTAASKPVVILKVGRGEAGKRGVLSHTGKIGGTDMAWDAVCKQTAAIRALDQQELIDLAVTFMYMPAPAGVRVCVLGVSGGTNILSADECERAGLDVVSFPAELGAQLRQIDSSVWMSEGNPIEPDGPTLMSSPQSLVTAIKVIADAGLVDCLVLQFPVYIGEAKATIEEEPIWRVLDAVAEAKRVTAMPMAMVWHRRGCAESYLLALQDRCLSSGIPCYDSAFQAANSIRRFVDYRSALSSQMASPKS